VVAFLAALALLAVIGAAAGWIYGVRVADEREANGASSSSAGPPVTQDPAPPPTQEVEGEPCLAVTEAAAESAGSPGGLVEIFYIRTEDDRQVWICRDAAGSIFYQGYVGPVGGDLVQGENALFLTTVQETADGYLATNDTATTRTTYHVTADSLTQSTGDDESSYDVVEQRP
jgi:hypothetical protein